MIKLAKELYEKVRTGTRDVRVYICSRSFKLFAMFYFTEFFIYEIPAFHDLFYDDAERLALGQLVELLWIAFRESSKTSIAKIFIVWCICYNKKDYICYDSYDKDNSEAALFDIVEALQTNRKLIRDFGHLYTEERKKDKPLQKKISSFITANKIRVRAYSTQESARGMVYGNKRPNLVIFDDIETSKTRDSRKTTLKIIKHIKEFRGGVGVDAAVIYLGNYITEAGVIAWLKKKVAANPKGMVRDIPVVENGNITWKDKFVMTDKEADRINKDIENPKMHKVSLEDKKRDLGERSYNEDMMNDPEAAGEPFFNRQKVNAALAKCKPPIEIDGGLMLWSEYDKSHRYAIGADTSKGKGLDSNTDVIMDFTVSPNEQIGSFASNTMSPDIFGLEIHRHSSLFGVCLCAPETNASSGGTCLSALRTVHPIEKIYRQRGTGKAGDPIKKDLGWETNRATKPEMFFQFRTAWEAGEIIINDKRILNEMKSYTQSDLSEEVVVDDIEEDGTLTRHFDLLTATVITWAVRHFAVVSDIDQEEYVQQPYETPSLSSKKDNSVVPTMGTPTKNRLDFLLNRKKNTESTDFETDTPWQKPGL